MAFDETLAARIRDALSRRKAFEERKMFGCVCFLLDGNALAGVWKDRLIARLGPDKGEAGALQFVEVPGYAALVLRRTYADLSKVRYASPPGGRWRPSPGLGSRARPPHFVHRPLPGESCLGLAACHER